MERPTRAQRARKRLEATAYHEAGHAVMAIDLRRAFKYVTIERDNESLGHVRFAEVGERFRPDIYADRRQKCAIEREVMIELAGFASEAHFTGRRNWVTASADFASVSELGLYLYQGDVLTKWLAFMNAQVAEMVASPPRWLRIQAVAEELLKHRTLSARHTRAVCRSVIASAVSARNLRGGAATHVGQGVPDRVP